MSLKGCRVLVTGGSGFIGSHLVHRLIREGAQVGVLVRYNSVMKNERLKDIWEKISIIEADLRNRGALKIASEFEPEVVFHLAAYNHVGQSFLQVEECFDVNAKGTANLIDNLPNASKFLYMSTSEVYGYQTRVPFSETMEPQPLSPYSITKYAGELYCRMKQRMKAKTSIRIARCFNAYGPYQSTKAVIPELILKCLRGGSILTTQGRQTREFNFVEDLIEGLLLLAEGPEVEGPVNLSCGMEIAIRDLVKKIADLTGTKSKLEIGILPDRPNEIWRMSGDNQRISKLLGWKPKTSLEEGLKKTIDWYREYQKNLS